MIIDSVSQSPQGSSDATSALICSSSMMTPALVSIRNILPGCSLPFRTIRSEVIDDTPISEAKITKPSSVTMNLPGRRPFLSRVAPTKSPSVKITAAGPSHGSITMEWYSKNART